MNIRLVCKRCKGLKFIGEQYYAHGTYYVDVTCLRCSHSRDIEVSALELFLNNINKKMKMDRYAKQKANCK